jgi:hypothetical protein
MLTEAGEEEKREGRGMRGGGAAQDETKRLLVTTSTWEVLHSKEHACHIPSLSGSGWLGQPQDLVQGFRATVKKGG